MKSIIVIGTEPKIAGIRNLRILQLDGTTTGVLIASSVALLVLCGIAVWITISAESKKERRRRMQYHQQNRSYQSEYGNPQARNQYGMQIAENIPEPSIQSRVMRQGDGLSHTSYNFSRRTPVMNNEIQGGHYDQSVAYGDQVNNGQSLSNQGQQNYNPGYQTGFPENSYFTEEMQNQNTPLSHDQSFYGMDTNQHVD